MKGRAPLREERGRQMTLLYCFETAFHETLRVQVRRHIVTGESFWSSVQISKEKEHTIAFDKISFLSLGFRKNRGFFLQKSWLNFSEERTSAIAPILHLGYLL